VLNTEAGVDMDFDYYEVNELGRTRLIPRKKLEEYCNDMRSMGFDIAWSDFETNKIFVE